MIKLLIMKHNSNSGSTSKDLHDEYIFAPAEGGGPSTNNHTNNTSYNANS